MCEDNISGLCAWGTRTEPNIEFLTCSCCEITTRWSYGELTVVRADGGNDERPRARVLHGYAIRLAGTDRHTPKIQVRRRYGERRTQYRSGAARGRNAFAGIWRGRVTDRWNPVAVD